jgi:hypothetical protein
MWATKHDNRLRAILAEHGIHTPFCEAWASLDPKFHPHRGFCGALATVFPGTASVEADSSVIKWEKDEYRTSLADISLEGILHAKQFRELAQFRPE